MFVRFGVSCRVLYLLYCWYRKRVVCGSNMRLLGEDRFIPNGVAANQVLDHQITTLRRLLPLSFLLLPVSSEPSHIMREYLECTRKHTLDWKRYGLPSPPSYRCSLLRRPLLGGAGAGALLTVFVFSCWMWGGGTSVALPTSHFIFLLTGWYRIFGLLCHWLNWGSL